MQLLPVLEIRHGKSVHAQHKNNLIGEIIREDVSPVIESWVNHGISRIHVVDVDAIESGEPENVDVIAEVKKRFPDVKLQITGGIKSIESAYVWADAGVDFLILNSKTAKHRSLFDGFCFEFPGKVLVEVDSRQVRIRNQKGISITKLLQQLEEDGAAGAIVTDIDLCHELSIAKQSLADELSVSIDIPIYMSSRVKTINDIKQLLKSSGTLLSGLLIGKILHSEFFSLSETHHLINQYQSHQGKPS